MWGSPQRGGGGGAAAATAGAGAAYNPLMQHQPQQRMMMRDAPAMMSVAQSMIGVPQAAAVAGAPPPQQQQQQQQMLFNEVPVAATSEEFARLEYFLQLCLSTSAVKVQKVTAIANPHLTQQFELVTQNQLVLDTWVNLDRPELQDSVRSLSTQGMQLPPQGMTFLVGSVTQQELGVEDGLCRFVLCKLGVGRPYCVQVEDMNNVQFPPLPAGFQSYYLEQMSQEQQAAAHGFVGVQHPYQHWFHLVDSAQVLPCYVVHFHYRSDELVQRQRADRKQKVQLLLQRLSSDPHAATLVPLVAQLAERMDDDSDADAHELQEIVDVPGVPSLQAVVQLVSKRFANLEETQLHQPKFWDVKLRQPVSFYDKMYGSHANGANASNKLVPIAQAYKEALDSSRQDDPLLLGRRHALSHQLELVDDRMASVRKQAAEIEEQIYSLLREALCQLQEKTDAKLSVLAASKVELNRQVQHIQWMEGFLDYERDALGKLDFLRAWDRHLALRAEVHGMVDVRGDLEVQPDLRVEGRVEVLDQHEAEQRAVSAGAFGGLGGGDIGSGAGMGAMGMEQALLGAGSVEHAGAGGLDGHLDMSATQPFDNRSQISANGGAGLGATRALGGANAGVRRSMASAGQTPGLAGNVGAGVAAVTTMPLGHDNAQVRNTSEFWVETLRKRRNETTMRQRYDQLGALLTGANFSVSYGVCATMPQDESDDMSRALLLGLEANGGVLPLLRGLLHRDVQLCSQVQLLLRENNFTAKLLSTYTSMIGTEYLRVTIGNLVTWICEQNEFLEVDPDRAPSGSGIDVKGNLRALTNRTQMFLERIMQSINNVPTPIRVLCSQLAQAARERFPGQHLNAVASFFFLRFIGPAIMMPDAVGVADVVPTEQARRTLTLVAKVLQKLGSRVLFKKEQYLLELNPYVSANLENVANFLERLSSPASLPSLDQLPPIAVSPEQRNDALVVVHRYLSAHFDEVAAEAQSGVFAESTVAARTVEQLQALLAQMGAPPPRPASYVAAERELAERNAMLLGGASQLSL